MNGLKRIYKIYNDILLLQCQIVCHFKQASWSLKNELVLEISISQDIQIYFSLFHLDKYFWDLISKDAIKEIGKTE